jgi:large subunit ribosomal protein L3
MVRGLLGRKLGMTQAFDDNGEVVALTIVQAGPCYVTQIRTPERDGYRAVQIGYEETKRLTRAEQGHLRGVPKLRHLRELPFDDGEDLVVGAKIDVSMLEPGELVDVTGTSKGHGFAGVVKRHGFRGGPKTHGQSDRHRAPGSVGSGTTPGRVFKGMRMAGRMGGERITVQNLQVMQVDPDRNLVALKGAVPGARNGLLLIRKSRRTP